MSSSSDPFAQFKTLGQVPVTTLNQYSTYTDPTYTGRYQYQSIPKYTEEYIFSIMNKVFNLSLENNQLTLLQDLYNSNDESNRKMAVVMFQGILLDKFKEKL